MIITFIGPADSGKSTLINIIKNDKRFTKKFLKIKGDDDFKMIKLYRKLFGTKTTTEFNNKNLFSKINEPIKASILDNFIYTLYALAIFVEFSFDYLKYEILFPDKILLKDRYIYDFIITYKCNFNINNVIINYLFTEFPKPYLSLYIDVSPEVLFLRNKNNIKDTITSNLSFHTKVVEEYKIYAERKKLLFIDNTIDASIAVDKIFKHFDNKKKILIQKQVLVISGPDGAGKTTLINNYKEYLLRLNIKIRIIHFYHDTILYKFLIFLGFYKEVDNLFERYEINRMKSKNTKLNGKPFIWALLSYFDGYLQYFISRYLIHAQVIVYDRFFYDYWVGFENLGIKHVDIFKRFTVIEQNTTVLTADSKLLYKRKPENILEYFNFAYSSYAKIAKDYKFNIIDTTILSEQETYNKFLTINELQ